MLRDAERKILRDVLSYHDYNASAAAETLGVSHTLISKRVLILGGVMPDDPRREPFNYQAATKERRKRPRAKHRDDHPATATKPDDSSPPAAPTKRGTNGAHAVESGPESH